MRTPRTIAEQKGTKGEFFGHEEAQYCIPCGHPHADGAPPHGSGERDYAANPTNPATPAAPVKNLKR